MVDHRSQVHEQLKLASLVKKLSSLPSAMQSSKDKCKRQDQAASSINQAVSISSPGRKLRSITMPSPSRRRDNLQWVCYTEQYICVCGSDVSSLSVLADSPFADVEVVADSWTKQSFSGIRTLPHSLEPGFRQQALYDTVKRGTQ